MHKERIIEKQQILLPFGIHQVAGQFEKGAVIRIIDTYGKEIGFGVVNFSTEELLQLTDQETAIANNRPFVIDIDHFVCHLDVPITVEV